jgi:hypothetical protein
VIIKLPHLFKPREYQKPFLKAMVSPRNPNGKKRAVLLDHRRTGKDKLSFNYMVMNAFHRVGIYYYFFPTYQQGRKILWDGIDKDGFKFLDHVPANMVANKNQTEMKLTLANGSIIQVVGSDNIDSVVGTNPVGCIFSEYALQDPRGWDYVRPILRENGGWSVFPYTPRGKNHGYDLYEMAKNNADWYVEKLTVVDTYGRGGTIGTKEIDQERLDGMNENLVQQEFYCSFDAAIQHAVFGDQMLKAREEGRITSVPYQKGLPVDTWWDLGRDTVAIWFTQSIRNEIRVIDCHDAIQSTLDKEWEVLQNRKYVYGVHHFPHDGDYKDYKTGKTPKEIASELGFEVEIVSKIGKDSQISAARMIFNRCWFDEKKCQRGLDALASWHFDWDENLRAMSRTPIHDWSSHFGDALCQLAVTHEDEVDWSPHDRYASKRKPNRSWMTA